MKVFSFLAVLALCAPAVQAAEEECGSVGVLKHCPLGQAHLTISMNDVLVSGFTDSGKDGVSIRLPADTRSWRPVVSVQGALDSVRFQETAISNGFLTSSVIVESTQDETLIAASFTGIPNSTYSVLVYREGVLQDSVGGVQSGAVGARILPILEPIPFPRIPEFPPVSPGPFNISGVETLDQRTNGQGACEWELPVPQSPRTARVVRFDLPNGKKVWGDKIRLVEEVPGAMSYPYTSFNGITLRATGIESLTISNQEIQ
jgi:hypothetical protein